MLLRLQKDTLTVKYKKGTHMYLADTLSRAYLETRTETAEWQLEFCLRLKTIDATSGTNLKEDDYQQN